VILRLSASGPDVRLHVPIKGKWNDRPLSWSALGQAFVDSLKQKVSKSGILPTEPVAKKTSILSHVRMHGREGLSHNERVRLWQVIRTLKKHRDWVIELVPIIGEHEINEVLVQKVRMTQRLIETFFTARGIRRTRIYPVWPGNAHRSGSTSGMRIQAVM
jgi:hypothetical protein